MRLLLLRILTLLLALSAFDTQPTLAQPNPPTPSPYVPSGYHFVFGDEFQGTALDRTKWEYRLVDQKYGEGVNKPESIIESGDGYLQLVTTNQGSTLYTGMIQSIQQFTYGYFEANIHFQSMQGHHGAFWLQSPTYGTYADNAEVGGAEIDIIEFFGSGRVKVTDAQQNVYWKPYSVKEENPPGRHNVFYNATNNAELSDTFHIFALLWTPQEYIFYIDGVETWRTTLGLSHVKENIVLSLVASTWEYKQLDKDKLPDEMQVDYVRVYAP